MRRHSTNLVGLIFGTAFTLAGTGLLIRETTGTSLDPAWSAGFGLMLLGVIALVATLVRGPRHDHEYVAPDVVVPLVVDAVDQEVPAGVTSDE